MSMWEFSIGCYSDNRTMSLYHTYEDAKKGVIAYAEQYVSAWNKRCDQDPGYIRKKIDMSNLEWKSKYYCCIRGIELYIDEHPVNRYIFDLSRDV